MPYDVVAANRQATQTGLALGAQMFSNSVRQQQLQSELALQKLQQQQAAEMLSWTMRQHHQAIDEEAQNAKNTATFMARIAPTLSVPTTNQLPSTEGMSPMIGPDGQPMGGTGPSIPGGTEQVVRQVPNPAYNPDMGAAYIESFLKGARDPAKVLATGGALTLHQADAQKKLAEANFQPRVITKDGVQMMEYAPGRYHEVKSGGAAAPTGAMERNVKFLDAQLANGQITQDQYDHAKEIALNLAPKVSAASEWMNRIEVTGLLKRREMLLEKQILEEEKLTAMEAKGIGGFTGVSQAKFKEQQRIVSSWTERVKAVEKEINHYKPAKAAATDQQPTEGSEKLYRIRDPKTGRTGTATGEDIKAHPEYQVLGEQ